MCFIVGSPGMEVKLAGEESNDRFRGIRLVLQGKGKGQGVGEDWKFKVCLTTSLKKMGVAPFLCLICVIFNHEMILLQTFRCTFLIIMAK